MTQATIVIANDRFGRSDAGLVYGGLFIQLDELRFPDARWSDFVVVILAWWCRALSRLLTEIGRQSKYDLWRGPTWWKSVQRADTSSI